LTEDDKIRLISLIIMLGIGVIIFWVFRQEEEKTWNNGFCSCGGRWEYMQPIGHAYSTDYIYKCDKCGKTHEFSKVR
jgi:hypothetical protein